MNKKCGLILFLILTLFAACCALAEVKVGDMLTFGQYEQDNEEADGKEPIEWRVLAVSGNEAQLISAYALDAQPYNTTYKRASWVNSSLRAWLNSDFYNDAFSDAEKAAIVTKSVVNRKEENTADAVTLLSCDEAKQLFADHPDRMAQPTEYAAAKNIYRSKKYGPGNVQWWLRTTSWEDYRRAAYVAGSGGVMTCGGNTDGRVDNTRWSVRPVIYLDIAAYEAQQTTAE